MDHFNATVKDGKLVKTRRGMQVSRQRFNGMSFVNASPHDVNAVGSGQPTPWGVSGASGPSQQQEIRFIEEGHGGDHHFQPEATQRRNIDSSGQLPSTAAHGARRRRKATVNKGKSPTDTTPKLNTPPHQPSPPPFGELSSQLGRPPFGRGEPQPNTNAASASPVEGVPRRLQAEPALIDDSRFHGYSSSGSRTMYPYEDLITYNPSRGADMYSMIAGDRAAQHCVFMCGAMVESVEMERPEPEDLTWRA
ncbi:hypothetical protein B0J18DRAFT_490284 [Chaetomium sp. MPI-SDFR-AT-0129]|nr:hypothetical protein B0J18DRAFT_490284 [Chaetomium sp. MPI-SDFR-AT-0129]